MYNAVIIAQISYDMNTVHLTPAMLNRLDAFQMKGFRYIFKIDHAYYSRVSNQEIYEKISSHGKNLQQLTIPITQRN